MEQISLFAEENRLQKLSELGDSLGSPLKNVLKIIGVNWKLLNDVVKSGEFIEVNNDDNRSWVYKTLWYSGGIIKANLIFNTGISGYVAAIIL